MLPSHISGCFPILNSVIHLKNVYHKYNKLNSLIINYFSVGFISHSIHNWLNSLLTKELFSISF